MAAFAPLKRPGHERAKILLIGDSITQLSFSAQHRGWGAGLAEWYQRTADVVNRGFSGHNSRWVRQSLAHILPATRGEDFVLATVFLGANDAVVCAPVDGDARAGHGGGQHVSVDEYASNIAAIVDAVRASCPCAAVLLITPPPVDSTLWPNRSIPQVRRLSSLFHHPHPRVHPARCSVPRTPSHDQVRPYRDAVLAVAKERGALALDLWTPHPRHAPDAPDAPGTGTGTGTIAPIDLSDLCDGLHLAGTGNDKVLWGIQSIVREKLPALVPEDIAGLPNVALHLPHWSVLTGKSEEETAGLLGGWAWP